MTALFCSMPPKSPTSSCNDDGPVCPSSSTEDVDTRGREQTLPSTLPSKDFVYPLRKQTEELFHVHHQEESTRSMKLKKDNAKLESAFALTMLGRKRSMSSSNADMKSHDNDTQEHEERRGRPNMIDPEEDEEEAKLLGTIISFPLRTTTTGANELSPLSIAHNKFSCIQNISRCSSQPLFCSKPNLIFSIPTKNGRTTKCSYKHIRIAKNNIQNIKYEARWCRPNKESRNVIGRPLELPPRLPTLLPGEVVIGYRGGDRC